MENTICLHITLFGYLNNLASEKTMGRDWIEMPFGTTAKDLVEFLGVTRYHLGSIVVNGAMVQPDQMLANGDEIKIVPIVGGG